MTREAIDFMDEIRDISIKPMQCPKRWMAVINADAKVVFGRAVYQMINGDFQETRELSPPYLEIKSFTGFGDTPGMAISDALRIAMPEMVMAKNALKKAKDEYEKLGEVH